MWQVEVRRQEEKKFHYYPFQQAVKGHIVYCTIDANLGTVLFLSLNSLHILQVSGPEAVENHWP